jgi:hypothetical protein
MWKASAAFCAVFTRKSVAGVLEGLFLPGGALLAEKIREHRRALER